VECPVGQESNSNLPPKCPANTTLETIILDEGYWRDSKYKTTIYECENTACAGSQEIAGDRRLTAQDANEHRPYCIDGHSDPLCQVCTQKGYYFSEDIEKCKECPSSMRVVIYGCAAFAVLRIVVGLYFRFRSSSFCTDIVTRISILLQENSLQTKFKIFISFYQVASTLQDVYGVRIADDLKKWFEFLQVFNLKIFKLPTFPISCAGSMVHQHLSNKMV